MFHIEYEFTQNRPFFDLFKGEKFLYDDVNNSPHPQILATSFLFEHELTSFEPEVMTSNGNIKLFPTACELGFDVFSAVFYMISRYEEYFPYESDQYGRFRAINSFSYKNNLLEVPVVNIWINDLKVWLLKKYPDLVFNVPQFEALLSYDIDVAYAYKGRGFLRNTAAIFKDLISINFKNLQERLKVIIYNKEDPWDIYKKLIAQLEHYKFRSIFFFLLGPYSRHDKNLHFKNKSLKQLIRDLFKKSQVGIHPSFNSFLNLNQIAKEKKNLELITGENVTKSRQHYLKFKLPYTYNYLEECGIKEDHTMGYPEMVGFRAGICNPFYFYDLKRERATKLKIFPITLMEASFIKYQKLTPEQAIEKVTFLIKQVKDVQGMFISVWHNNTLSDSFLNKEWRKVHDFMLEEISRVTSV